MSVTIVLADGFDGEGVEVLVAGRTYVIEAARTSLLTGMAKEIVVDADGGPVRVSARLVPTGGPQLAGVTYEVPQGAVLVLNRRDGRLSGQVQSGPLGFA